MTVPNSSVSRPQPRSEVRKSTSLRLTLAVVALLAGGPTVALAQARATPAAAPAPIAQGPAIPGLCVLSVNQAIASSQVGGYVRTRLDQIVAQVKAELAPEDTSISNDARALETQRPTLDAATYQKRGNDLSVRIQALRQKADLRNREVKATEDKALNRIAQELEPIAQSLYVAHHCSALLDKGSVMMANPDMDLTGAAVTALNGKITQFAFDREHLDTAPATGGH
jgi:Skp family chaperone for outer membrane proteins